MLSSTGDLQRIRVNCWRLTLYSSPQKAAGSFVDGVPVGDVLTGAGGATAAQAVTMGGAYMNGVPLNLEHEFLIGKAGVGLAYFMVLEYIEPAP